MRALRHVAAASVLGVLLLSLPLPALAQSVDELQALRREIETLKQGQAGIQRELQEIKALLRTRPTAPAGSDPRDARLRGDGGSARGDTTARVTIVEFSDFQCPFCALYARDTFPQLERDYIDTGKVRYVVRIFRSTPSTRRPPEPPRPPTVPVTRGSTGRCVPSSLLTRRT